MVMMMMVVVIMDTELLSLKVMKRQRIRAAEAQPSAGYQSPGGGSVLTGHMTPAS